MRNMIASLHGPISGPKHPGPEHTAQNLPDWDGILWATNIGPWPIRLVLGPGGGGGGGGRGLNIE